MLPTLQAVVLVIVISKDLFQTSTFCHITSSVSKGARSSPNQVIWFFFGFIYVFYSQQDLVEIAFNFNVSSLDLWLISFELVDNVLHNKSPFVMSVSFKNK